MRVIFSNRAFSGVLAETTEKITTETGGLFLGVVQDDTWYIVEAIDPGPKSIFEVAYFEYDQKYTQHLINKIANLYGHKLDLIGLWHRHPGSFDQFSSTDDGTNSKFVAMRKEGAISGLVNIDPTFRFTIYHVGQPCHYRKIAYEVGDNLIPNEFLAYRSPEKFYALMQKRLNPESRLHVRPAYKRTVSLDSFMRFIAPAIEEYNTNASVYCIDGDKLVGDDGSAEFYDTISEATPRFKVADDRADIIKFVNEVYQNYQFWKKQNSDQVIFVVIKNLQFLDIVKAMFKGEQVDESEFLDNVSEEPALDPNNPFAAVTGFFENRGNDDSLGVGEKLLKLVADGSGFGIHFVVTSLEYQTVRECMYYGENILTKFPERIIFSLGSNDADNLIENVSVSGLRDNTVYFTDGVKNTFQMKPYILPGCDQLKEFFRNSKREL